MTDTETAKMNAIINLKLNATLQVTQSIARMVGKVHMKPSKFEQFDSDLKRASSQLDADIADIMNLGDNVVQPQPRFWVTNHDTVPENKRVSGPYTTSADAGKARAILERFENHNNYWIEELED